ncbi:hypothetical protein LCGC14_0560460 [marine sediment metagenome]|uniref:Uncharacterized protein n=1 Tax=marine sediment metagenome TaxID=412755 RepID=A0A0F9S5T4_9ZZZZ|nr:hypothetical protein [Methylophaga sp.]HEC59331.1 hypothetical protein [Methylophaga sp.]
MTTEIATLLALLVSLAALVYLRNTDTKRRRVFKLPLWTKPKFDFIAWSVCLLPSVVLLCLELYGPFIMWFAALSLLGWFVALPKPKSV